MPVNVHNEYACWQQDGQKPGILNRLRCGNGKYLCKTTILDFKWIVSRTSDMVKVWWWVLTHLLAFIWNDPWRRNYFFVTITYVKVRSWLWKSPKGLSNFSWPPVVIRTHLQFFIIGNVLFERCNQWLILAERYLQISTEIAVFEDVVCDL